MPESVALTLPDPAATDALGAALARAQRATAPSGLVVWLHGGLGAGKTALARAWLAGLGHRGRVPSPTYTLVEPYELPGWTVRHADLYRLGGPGEIDDLALDEPADQPILCLVEWPGRGRGRLPPADLEVFLEPAGSGRRARLLAASAAGRRLLAALPPPAPNAPYQAPAEDDPPSP
jgi:tRNA threonylcarbamoyladenosine biosynthesis protein TsaE